jgi:large subunit ribosomal protein L4
MRIYMANQRQGTSAVKTRAFVARTKRKWFKQKGTGNARHGARSAPIFVGGGVAHGPKANQNWALTLTQRTKLQSLVAALRAQAAQIVVAKDLDSLDGKAKTGATYLAGLTTNKSKILVVLVDKTPAVVRSLRNLPQVLIASARQLSAFEVAAASTIIMSEDALKAVEERVKTVLTTKAAAVSETKVVAKPVEVKKITTAKKSPKVAKKEMK